MKTICVKVKLTLEQEKEFSDAIQELEWIWNFSLKTYIHNHCVKWYDWATNIKAKIEKALAEMDKLAPEQKKFVHNYFFSPNSRPLKMTQQQNKLVDKEVYKILNLWSPFDFDGITKVPLRLSERSAYVGASCAIAEGGPYWISEIIEEKDPSGEVIKYTKSKLVSGKPYVPINKKEHSYPLVPSGQYKDRQIIDWTDLVVKSVLSSAREHEGLPPLTLHSNYINGLLSQNGSFQKSWSAFLDIKRMQSKRPKFKNEDYKLNTLLNFYPPIIPEDRDWIEVRQLGKLEVIDRNWRKRMGGDLPRSHCITKKRSGYYVNITTEHPLYSEKTVLLKQLAKVKKEQGKDSQEYLDLEAVIKSITEKITGSKIKPKKKELSVGIDPGINAIIATDQGDLYMPNLSRERITFHIEKLQAKLKHMQDVNDKIWREENQRQLEEGEKLEIKTKRPKTNNELKLEHKIARLHERGANSSRHFNHKLSSRIAKTYKHVCWEDTKIANLMKSPKPKQDLSGIGYLPNGAAAKRSINWLFKQRCLGDLKERTKQKVLEYGGVWHDSAPKYSSQKCHCCGYTEPLQRDGSNFTCKNDACKMYGISQNADVNAARNHKKSFFELEEVKYHNLNLEYSVSARRKHKSRNKAKPVVSVIKLSNK